MEVSKTRLEAKLSAEMASETSPDRKLRIKKGLALIKRKVSSKRWNLSPKSDGKSYRVDSGTPKQENIRLSNDERSGAKKSVHETVELNLESKICSQQIATQSELEYIEEKVDYIENESVITDLTDDNAFPSYGEYVKCRSASKKTEEDSLSPLKEILFVTYLLLALLVSRYDQLQFLAPWFTMSHQDLNTGLYKKGGNDVHFVALGALFFISLRYCVIKYMLRPLAYLLGLQDRKKAAKFYEQSWYIFIYSISWTSGLILWHKSTFFMSISNVWLDYPQLLMSSIFKRYYLTQFAFWFSQLLIVHIESRRKDHYQMVCHHVVTLTLLAMSYAFNVTHVGLAILCVMDVVDILLPLAKILKYIGQEFLCDCAFVAFLLTWIFTRHYLFGKILWSAAFESPKILGGYHWIPSQGYMFTRFIHYTFIALLLALQSILILWLWMILRIVVIIFTGNSIKDTRSDEDSSD